MEQKQGANEAAPPPHRPAFALNCAEENEGVSQFDAVAICPLLLVDL